LNLRAFISQRLIPTVDGKRCLAVEILLGTPLVCDLILKGQIHKIKEVMDKSTNIGMQTFDGALFELYKDGKISLEEALRNADSQNNLRLKISLSEGRPGGDNTNLSLAHEEEPPAQGALGALSLHPR